MNHQIAKLQTITLIFGILLSNLTNIEVFNLSNPALARTSDIEQNEQNITQRLNELDNRGEIMVRSQFVVNPEKINEFVDIASEVAAFANGKDNPVLYRFFQNIEQPERFVLVEQWSNTDAIAEHKNTAHAQNFQNNIAELISEPVQSRIYRLASEPAPEDGEVDRALVEAQPGATPTISQTRDRLAQYDLVEAPFVLLVDVPVRSGGAATMKDTAVRVQSATLEEPGSIRYGYYQDVEQPTSFLLFEWWREFNDMAKHVELPHFQELMKTFGAVGGDGRTVALYKPLPLP